MCRNKLTSSSVFLRGMEEAYFLKFPELGRVEAGEPMVHMEVFSLSPDREAGRQQGGLGGLGGLGGHGTTEGGPRDGGGRRQGHLGQPCSVFLHCSRVLRWAREYLEVSLSLPEEWGR